MSVNLTYPAPQADRLDKVAVVVDAVQVGADTFDAIARALEVVERQGSYYANAAGYLGLIEQVPGSHPVQWRLTGDGEMYWASDADMRQQILATLVAEVPAVQLILEADGDLSEAIELYTESGLDVETATRRAQTAHAWTAILDEDAAATARTIGDGARTVRDLATVIAAELAKARRAAEPVVHVCSGCWTQLPASGRCDTCD